MRLSTSHLKFLRFVISGGINTAVTYLLFLLLTPVLGHMVAYSISYVTGIALSYLLNLLFVFRVAPSWGSAMMFPLVYVAQYLCGVTLMYILVDRLGFSPAIGLLATIAVSIPLTFALTRRVVTR